ncbi:MAG TPA: EAL domain-containing protein [Solirubrobacteraceae bacterium]|jgi:EAL domain-containing protein (putative c-di-GMP-specific phosphodiesterase class I)|nr:EAL domain-containing protein [Solirubrobacteraceae bacterium]
MASSTTVRATPRLLMAPFTRPAHTRYRRIAEPDVRAARISSRAGLARRPWLARLRSALERDLFVLHFQPIVSLADGRVTHHEALVRLADDADGRLIGPASFLPAAERYGLIRAIDRMVLEKVAAQLARMPPAAGAVAMNLSALSVTDRAMLAHVVRALERHGADPSRLVIEVTETASISDMPRAREFCERVHGLGCAIALDDFGAGFGSFHYLKHLPFDYLKIDGAFIRGLPDSAHDQLVVKALVGLVREMGQQTIAEFVGDQRTIELLRELGVDYAQGFEIGRPQAVLAT